MRNVNKEWHDKVFNRIIDIFESSGDKDLAYKYMKALIDYWLTGEYDKSDWVINALIVGIKGDK